MFCNLCGWFTDLQKAASSGIYNNNDKNSHNNSCHLISTCFPCQTLC